MEEIKENCDYNVSKGLPIEENCYKQLYAAGDDNCILNAAVSTTLNKNPPKQQLKDSTEYHYVDRLERLPGHQTVNCRHIKSRNHSDIYVLSPKNTLLASASDVSKSLDAIRPDGLVLGCDLKRFKMFYNASKKTAEPTKPSQYITDFLTFGIAHSWLHFIFDLTYHGKPELLQKSNVGQLHLPAVDYVNNNTHNPNIVVRYGDTQYRHVLNNLFFLNIRNISTAFQYYNGQVSPKIGDVIKHDEKFFRLFMKHRSDALVHSCRKLSSHLKFSPDHKAVNPKIVILCEEWESQYICSEWKTFFEGEYSADELTWVPRFMMSLKSLVGFYILFLFIAFAKSMFNWIF